MPDGVSAVVLDTHVWLWVINGEPLALPARNAILAAATHGLVYIPAIAIWEIGMLEAKGRLALDAPVATWVIRALGAPGTKLVPLSPEVALDSTRLPGALHGDPCDRMVVATARRHDALLITRDEKLVRYGQAGFLAVIPA